MSCVLSPFVKKNCQTHDFKLEDFTASCSDVYWRDPQTGGN